MPDFYYGQKGNDDFTEEAIINFEDPLVKSLCVANWDTNGDSELSYGEARAVEDIGKIFYKTDITTFDELQYFSGLTTIPEWAFSNCRQLRSILLPETVREIRDNAFTYASGFGSVSHSCGRGVNRRSRIRWRNKHSEADAGY